MGEELAAEETLTTADAKIPKHTDRDMAAMRRKYEAREAELRAEFERQLAEAVTEAVRTVVAKLGGPRGRDDEIEDQRAGGGRVDER